MSLQKIGELQNFESHKILRVIKVWELQKFEIKFWELQKFETKIWELQIWELQKFESYKFESYKNLRVTKIESYKNLRVRKIWVVYMSCVFFLILTLKNHTYIHTCIYTNIVLILQRECLIHIYKFTCLCLERYLVLNSYYYNNCYH